MSAQHHVIRREVLKVAVQGTEADGFALHRKLGALCNDWLAPALDEALSRIAPPDEHWLVERLEVDAGAFTVESIGRDFAGVVAAAVERQIREWSAAGASARHIASARESGALATNDNAAARESDAFAANPGGAIRRLSGARSNEEALAWFLATGALPWWFVLPAGETLESVAAAALFVSESFAGPGSCLFEALAAPVARMRLVRQFSAPFLSALLDCLARQSSDTVKNFETEMAGFVIDPEPRRKLGEHLWRAAFALAATRRAVTPATLIVEWSSAFSPDDRAEQSLIFQLAKLLDAPLPDEANEAISARAAKSTPAPDISRPRLDLDEGIFVACAGIVLLHPFLPALFERLGIAAQDTLQQPDRAFGVLHFLATGEKRAPEHVLVLAKLLCGLPLEAPAGAVSDLTDEDAAEAGNLLSAVIGHWGALGGASPDALRGTFLTRPGKLSRRGEDDLLQVEPQSFDLLLERLPWGIGAIRLPWMKRMLWVEWRM